VTTFDIDDFVTACIEVTERGQPIEAVREIVARSVSAPGALEAAFPVPIAADDDGVLHRSSTLFISQGLFPRGFATGIHDHRVAAVIGVWGGYEDNLLYRRTSGGIEACGGRRVGVGEVLVLEPDAIHDVHAPADTWSAAIHVYLGDLVALQRSSWPDVDGSATCFDGADLEDRWLEAAATTGIVRPV
jgi:predicted metal-dependent enzyme (double-stranded beta helix superfamily)